MKQIFPRARWACLLPSLGLLSLAGSASAAVTLTATSLFDIGTSRYTYNYSVVNSGTTEELIMVTFPVSVTAALLGITAPTGFKITYDTIGARVNFLMDDNDFTPQTFAANSSTSGFSFTSRDLPGPVQFMAQDAVADFSGSTIAPVPEPSVVVLGLAAVPMLLRRRRA